jgi:hypothetical protein
MISKLLLLSALIVLVSCSNYNQYGKTIPLINESKPDTIKPIIVTSLKTTAYPNIFEVAFSNNTKVKEGNIDYNFYKLNIGKIKIESGRLIACDPIVMRDATPFTQHFPIGDFPVHLAMAKTFNDQRVAFSRIVFSDKEIIKWEFALHNGQKPIPLKDTSFYCYGVDAGIGIFIDSIANNFFNQKDHSEWETAFIAKAEKNGYTGYLHDFDGHNLATFSTGYGDGCYATYIGFDKEGNVCQLLTDFGLVEWWKLEEKK